MDLNVVDFGKAFRMENRKAFGIIMAARRSALQGEPAGSGGHGRNFCRDAWRLHRFSMATIKHHRASLNLAYRRLLFTKLVFSGLKFSFKNILVKAFWASLSLNGNHIYIYIHHLVALRCMALFGLLVSYHV